jgi:hypothetical protein
VCDIATGVKSLESVESDSFVFHPRDNLPGGSVHPPVVNTSLPDMNLELRRIGSGDGNAAR